ncbi:unnamed protein product [Pylaiella littoralis]
MAEGFIAADYTTNLRLSELQGKRLWLVRVPRHIDPSRLEGVKVKLPARKGREGKVLGRVTKADDTDSDTDSSSDRDGRNKEEDGLVLRAADVAESHGFRALFSTEEEGALGAAPPFAGQVNVVVDTPALEPIGLDADTRAAGLVEPYRGRPQLKGMRVRSKPAGAGSEYTRTRPPASRHGKDQDEPPATPVQGDKRMKSAAASGETRVQLSEGSPVAEPPTGSKKKKKRKSAGGGRDATVKLEKESSVSPGTKKFKKKKTASAIAS